MNLHGQKVLVTGAGGFIGSHLAEQLVRAGCSVTAMLHYDSRPDRGNLEFVAPDILAEMEICVGDVRDSHFVAEAVHDCQVVFHLAALIAIPYSYMAPASYVETNVLGTLNVLQACRQADVQRLVHTSTSECYGTAQYTPIDEHHPLQAQSPYAASKIGADKLVESFYLSYGLPAVTVRPFNTFGPRQSARAVIPTILSQLLVGQPELHLGAVTPVRDLNYVCDIVEGFIALAQCDAAVGQLVNLGSGTGITIAELAAIAMKVVGREVPIQCDEIRLRPERSEVMTLICDAGRARMLTGWQPRVGLAEGLQQTAHFIREHLDRYRPEEYTR